MRLLGFIVFNKASSRTELKISMGHKKSFRHIMTEHNIFFKLDLEALQLLLPMPPQTKLRRKKAPPPQTNPTCSLYILLAFEASFDIQKYSVPIL